MKATSIFFLVLAALLAPAVALGGICGDLWPAPVAADCREAVFVDDMATVISDGQTLIALAGRRGVGFSVWAQGEDSADLAPLYQDLGNRSREVRILHHGGTHYAFAAGPQGVFVYDVTQAQSLAHPCFDDGGTVCPGVFQGRLGETRDVGALDVFERGGSVYVVTSGDAVPVEIWAISNPAIPGMAVRKLAGPRQAGPASPAATGAATDVAFFELHGSAVLAVSELGPALRLQVYDVEGCLGFAGCDALGPPLWTETAEVLARLDTP